MTKEANGPKARRPEARDPNVLAFVGTDRHTLAQTRSIFAAAATPRKLDGYPDVAAALAGISRRPPAAVLVDLGMSAGHGPDALNRLRRRFPGLPFIALAPAGDPHAVLLALIAGAAGCVVQPAPAELLVRAVNQVLKDGVFLCSKAQTHVVRCLAANPCAGSGCARLSPREEQIAVGLLEHRTNHEIANKLGVSAATVHAHLDRLYRKLRVHGRREVVDTLLRQA